MKGETKVAAFFMQKLNVVSRCQTLYRSQQLPLEDLNGVHHSMVLVVAHDPGLSQDQIASRLCLNKSTVARALTRLEDAGYVDRRADAEDRRVLRVYPTEKMLAVHSRVREISRQWNELLSENCTEEELAVFHSVLSRMAERAKEIVKEQEDSAQ